MSYYLELGTNFIKNRTDMSKEIFLKGYTEKVIRNYDKLERYFNDDLIILSALNQAKSQIINCLMIEQNSASITLTNYFVERMLKTALIQQEVYGLKISENNSTFNIKLIKRLIIMMTSYCLNLLN